MTAGAHSERLAYQPHATANESLIFSNENMAARQGGNDLNRSLPAAQPTRAASMHQTPMRYQAPADGDMHPDISIIRPTGPPPSYVSNNVPLTSYVDVIRPTVPVSSVTQLVSTEQHKSLHDSFDLPAPPTPPSTKVVPSVLSGDRLPSPPMMITPPPYADSQFSALPLPQYLPPPELVAGAAPSDVRGADHHNGDGCNVASAAIDNNSDSSSLITSQQTDDTKNDQPLVRDTRSDLLAAIREGMWFVLIARDVYYVFSI